MVRPAEWLKVPRSVPVALRRTWLVMGMQFPWIRVSLVRSFRFLCVLLLLTHPLVDRLGDALDRLVDEERRNDEEEDRLEAELACRKARRRRLR